MQRDSNGVDDDTTLPAKPEPEDDAAPHGDELGAEALLPVRRVTRARAERFYDRIRSSIEHSMADRSPRLEKFGEFLFFVPDVFILLFRLTTDKRVTTKSKMLLGSGLAYYIFPLDVMPELLLGPIGFLDDLVLGVYILNRILSDTDEEILREHWSGRGDVLEMIRKVLGAADRLVATDFLKKVKKIVK